MRIDQYFEKDMSIQPYRIRQWHQQTRGKHTVCISPHWHIQLEFLRIISGKLQMTVGEETFQAEAGALIIINPKQIHSGICLSEELTYDVVQIDIAALINDFSASRRFLEPLINEKVRFIVNPADTTAPQILTELIDYLHSDQHPLIIVAKIYQTVGELYRLYAVEQGIFNTTNEKLRQALEYIDNHYCEPLSVRLICQQFNYNKSYFCRIFKKATGLTLSAYIRILRMEKAQRLLQKPGISISQVAAECGYSDPDYFRVCMRKHFKQAPSELRDKLSQG